jgi:hypothetical protein
LPCAALICGSHRKVCANVIIGEGVQEVSPVFSCGSGVHQTLNVLSARLPGAYRFTHSRALDALSTSLAIIPLPSHSFHTVIWGRFTQQPQAGRFLSTQAGHHWLATLWPSSRSYTKASPRPPSTSSHEPALWPNPPHTSCGRPRSSRDGGRPSRSLAPPPAPVPRVGHAHPAVEAHERAAPLHLVSEQDHAPLPPRPHQPRVRRQPGRLPAHVRVPRAGVHAVHLPRRQRGEWSW